MVTRCIERGINYIDACTHAETQAYSLALKGRREKMHLGWSWYEHEARRRPYRIAETLVPTLDEGMREAKEEYVDLWRITCNVDGRRRARRQIHHDPHPRRIGRHRRGPGQGEEVGQARRRTGVSSHDRVWLSYMVEKFPDQIDVVVTPYTAKSKVLKTDSFFDSVRKCNCGFFGIKPFASNSLFKGDSSPDSPHREEDDRIARLAIRYILCNAAITAPIPGLVTRSRWTTSPWR